MRPAVTSDTVTTQLVAEILTLVDEVETISGDSAVGDHGRLALNRSDPAGTIVASARDAEGIAGFVLLTAANDSWTLDAVVAPGDRGDGVAVTDLVTATLDQLVRDGHAPTRVTWWNGDAHSVDPGALGFALERELLVLGRALPTGLDVHVETRSFISGQDDAALLDVNNRAFAGHPEQGGWTRGSLALRTSQPWFDPDGVRLHDRGGRLAGFCWTKVHEPTPPDHEAIGEIYVIAVDPDFARQGLGTQLTLAGLEHLAGRGVTEAILYVDASNHAAVTMYERLGFSRRSTTRAFVRDVRAHVTDTTEDNT